MSIFRRQELVPVIKNAFLPHLNKETAVVDANTTLAEEVVDSVLEEEQTLEVPSAYPMVQPMKAALYFDSAEGFGEWRILISTRANRNLREARNKDPTSFRIYLKKIK